MGGDTGDTGEAGADDARDVESGDPHRPGPDPAIPAIPANGTPRWVVPFLAMTQLPTPAPIGPLSQGAAIQRNRWPHLPESIRQD